MKYRPKKEKKKHTKINQKKKKLAEEFQRVVQWQKNVTIEMAVKSLGQGTAGPGCWKSYREKKLNNHFCSIQLAGVFNFVWLAGVFFGRPQPLSTKPFLAELRISESYKSNVENNRHMPSARPNSRFSCWRLTSMGIDCQWPGYLAASIILSS
jgi:hypothetical protein